MVKGRVRHGGQGLGLGLDRWTRGRVRHGGLGLEVGLVTAG